MIQDLRKRMVAKIEKMQEMFNKDLEELKNKQTELNNTITEMKNAVEGINSRITEAEEFTAAEQNKEKRMKRNEDSLGDLWDNIKCNSCIIGVPEGEEREKGPKKIFKEIIIANFPNMGKEIATQVQEVQRVPGRINRRRNMLKYIIIKLAKIKDKDKLLKAAREKRQITYKGIPIMLTADLSAETLQARKEWHDILKVMKGKNLQPRLLYLARISFRFDGEIKRFTDKQKLREFNTAKPTLQQMLKELL